VPVYPSQYQSINLSKDQYINSSIYQFIKKTHIHTLINTTNTIHNQIKNQKTEILVLSFQTTPPSHRGGCSYGLRSIVVSYETRGQYVGSSDHQLTDGVHVSITNVEFVANDLTLL